MSKKWYSLLLIATMAVLTFGLACKDDTESPEESPFETLTMYMAANDMDLDDVLDGWIIAAADIVDNLDDYYIMDIRSAETYAAGHIPGAVNSSLSTIVTDAALNTTNKPIIVACYTGQSAGHALCALRLSGYPDAKSLKFGMSSWNADFDRWTDNCASPAVGHANWTTDAVATPQTFSDPTLTATATDGPGMLAERVTAMLTGGYKGVTATDVLETPGDYFINNYWAQSDVDLYGHIAGAYRIKEDLTLAADGFSHLDPSRLVVTYCWTGQTSSVVTAYLTVLGYDAASLRYGANGLIYDELLTSKWTGPEDFEYETG